MLGFNFGEELNSGQFADFIISVSGKEIPTHRIILVQYSKFFKAMLSHEMKESKTNRLEIKDQKLSVIQAMLRYIYTGRVNSLEPDSGGSARENAQFYSELLLVADMYQLDGLKSECENLLCELVAEETLDYLMVFAVQHKLMKLRGRACRYVVDADPSNAIYIAM